MDSLRTNANRGAIRPFAYVVSPLPQRTPTKHTHTPRQKESSLLTNFFPPLQCSSPRSSPSHSHRSRRRSRCQVSSRLHEEERAGPTHVQWQLLRFRRPEWRWHLSLWFISQACAKAIDIWTRNRETLRKKLRIEYIRRSSSHIVKHSKAACRRELVHGWALRIV